MQNKNKKVRHLIILNARKRHAWTTDPVDKLAGHMASSDIFVRITIVK